MLVMIVRDEAMKEYAGYLGGIEVPCTITAAEVSERKENGINREVVVRFRYEVSGKSHDGEWAGPVFKRRSATPEEIDATLTAHPPGSTSVCRVNLDAPGSARLHADFPWNEFGGAIFISGFFLTGLYLMISSVGKLPEPGIWTPGEKSGRIVGFVAGVLFSGVGYGMLWKTWENKLTRPDTSGWVETPCVIDAASVRKIPGRRTSYKFETQYAYRIGDGAYRGSEIRPGMQTVGVSGERDALVSRYAPGTRATCRVDPENPRQAVLEGPADESGTLLMGTVFFGVFAAIGTLLTVGCAIGPGRFTGKGYSKFFTLVFIGGVASIFVTTAILLPNIRIQGIPTDSWVARLIFGGFGVVVCAVVARSTWRQIDKAPAKAPQPRRNKKRRR